MKSLPKWSIGLIVILITLLVILSVGNFANKSQIFARGTLQVAKDLEDLAKGIRTVFIVVYDEESQMPMPYAAIKEQISEDPKGQFIDFVLTKDNMQLMNPNNHKIPNRIRIKARLDRNGLGGMDQPGDLTGAKEHVAVGSEGVLITIDKLIEAS